MRRGLLLCTAALLLSVSAVWAQERVPAPMNSLDWEVPAGPSSAEGAFYMEDFETFVVGQQVAGQNGWTSDFAPNTEVVQPGILNISARHFMDGTLISGFEMNSASFPPQFAPALGVDVQISGNGGLYQIVADSDDELFITRINFETNGEITIGQGDPGCTMFVFQPTTGAWAPGVTTRIGIETPGDGSLLVYQDFDLIFVGQDLNDQCFAGPEGIARLLVWADNAGNGDASGAGDTLTLDEISELLIAVPVAATDIPVLDWRGLSLLLLAILVAAFWVLRRRRTLPSA